MSRSSELRYSKGHIKENFFISPLDTEESTFPNQGLAISQRLHDHLDSHKGSCQQQVVAMAVAPVTHYISDIVQCNRLPASSLFFCSQLTFIMIMSCSSCAHSRASRWMSSCMPGMYP